MSFPVVWVKARSGITCLLGPGVNESQRECRAVCSLYGSSPDRSVLCFRSSVSGCFDLFVKLLTFRRAGNDVNSFSLVHSR